MPSARSNVVVAVSALLLALCSGCGAGTAGIVSSGGSDNGGGQANADATISAFSIHEPKVSPTHVSFVLSDEEADPATVELSYRVGGANPTRLTQISGLRKNPSTLPTSAEGIVYELDWGFADEPDLPDDASYVPDIQVFGLVAGGVQEIQIGANAAATGLGNDPPDVVSALVPKVEVDGIIGVSFTIRDSSDDVVRVRIEYDVIGDVPDAGWQLARPALLETTPEYAFDGVVASSEESALEFFWDTDADLSELERDVRLRFTAIDPVVGGAPLVTEAIHVDNNAAPSVQLQNDLVVTNPDERRGIPIPFRVIDEEEDLVEVIFQWRREGETFPALPSDEAQLDAILADPAERRAHRICTPYPRYAQGRVVPLDADSVRLPELAAGESWIVASGLEGKMLDLLRASSAPVPITPSWSTNPLASPIAALAIGDGLSALILDTPGFARLREIELATGAVVREIATLGSGIPSAMDFERGGENAVLVALDSGGVWRIVRVELASGAVSELIVSDGAEPAPVRGIASVGTHAAVFTAGSSLLFCDWQDPLAPQLGRISTGLAAPWGVVVDPLAPGRLYVSERNANRVLAVDLNSHGTIPVVVHSAPLQLGTFDSPEALSLEQHGSRLLVVTGAPGGLRQIEGLNLGGPDGNVSFPIDTPLAMDITSLASGRDGLRLACIAAAHDLLAGGGVEQRRTIVAYDALDVQLDAAFQPPARSGQGWRIAPEPIRGSTGGRPASFAWSSGVDVPNAGRVFVRAIARDDELGPAFEGSAPKTLRADLRAELGVESLVLGNFHMSPRPKSVATADLDGDGDTDLVTTSEFGSNLTVFFQVSPRSFASTPLVLGGGPPSVRPRSVAAADLDDDGDIDLVSANEGSHNLTVFFQTSPGSFASPPLVLGLSSIEERPVCVAAADLDGDGDIDLVSANEGSHSNLTVYFQTSPGNFATESLVLGGPLITDSPGAVAAADLDGDGDTDVVSANTVGSNLTVFFQTSPGSFTTQPLVLGGLSITEIPTSVAAADLDDDGDLDVVSTNTGSSNLTVFFQTSPGSFTTQPLVLGLITEGLQPVAAGDLDGDGDIDIVADDLIFVQDSQGRFSAVPLVLGAPSAPVNLRHHGTVADLDGDGDLDIISFVRNDADSTENLTVFFQASPGSFSSPALERFELFLAVADLDGDGDADFASTSDGSDGEFLTIFVQTSPGSFEPQPLVLDRLQSAFPRSVAAADLDGDGDVDLVAPIHGGVSGDNNLTVIFQSSPGSFAPRPLVLDLPQFSFPNSVLAADLDSDGDIDLLSVNTIHADGGDDLTVFFQTSPGNFELQPKVLGGPTITNALLSVAAADLDGDGDLDLVRANSTNSSGGGANLSVSFQTSPGSFAPRPLVLEFPQYRFPNSVAPADVEGDGDLDLVSANGSFIDGGNLTVFFQTTPGSFTPEPFVLGGPSITNAPFSVAAADLDGDSDIDLVSANGTNSSGGVSYDLTVFFQTSPGSFAPQPLILDGPTITTGPVFIADLDGDGDLDLVSGNTVFWGGR